MRLSTFALAVFAAIVAPVQADRCRLGVEEASLGVDPRDNSGAEVTIDIYRCTKNNGFSRNNPLVVFACGGSVPKSAYNTFASGLAEEGYVVVTIEHPVSFGPGGPPFNFANAVDVQNAISYVENQNFSVDTSKIVLMGHSFGSGTVLNAINEVCDFPFCNDPNVPFPQSVTVPRHPGIVLAAAYGASLNDRSGGFSSLTNLDIPYGIINGAGDINFFTEIAGENLTQGSFDRLEPTKVIGTIDNLDHFSISKVGSIRQTALKRSHCKRYTVSLSRLYLLYLPNGSPIYIDNTKSFTRTIFPTGLHFRLSHE